MLSPFCSFISWVARLFSSVSKKRSLHRGAWWEHRMLDANCAYLVTCFSVFGGQTRSYREKAKVSILERTTAYQLHEKHHWERSTHIDSDPPCFHSTPSLPFRGWLCVHFAWEFGLLFPQCCIPEASTVILSFLKKDKRKEFLMPLLCWNAAFLWSLFPVECRERPQWSFVGTAIALLNFFTSLEQKIVCGLAKAGMHI